VTPRRTFRQCRARKRFPQQLSTLLVTYKGVVQTRLTDLAATVGKLPGRFPNNGDGFHNCGKLLGMDLWLSGQLPGPRGASAARLGRIPRRPPGRARHRAPGSAEPGMPGSARGSPLRNRGADANRCCQQGYSQGRRIARRRLPLKTPGFRRREKPPDPRQQGYPQLWITCGYFLVVMWITSLVRGVLTPVRRNGSAAGGR
jgi:hypothetical protein